MEKLIQICTDASLYNGKFDNSGWAAAGMGYILVTKNNRLIVIDGGCSEDAPKIIKMLEDLSHELVPTVDLWIITHSHGDHYGALMEICNRAELAARIKIKELLYYFPEEFIDNRGNTCNIAPNEDMEKVIKLFGAKRHTPAIDEKFDVDGLAFHFLYVPLDCEAINNLSNANICSLIFTITAENKKVMITGDAWKKNLSTVVESYCGELKCDILQLPHHALCDTGNSQFYREVGAETVILPTSIAGNRAMNTLYYDQNGDNREAVEHASRVIKAFEGNIEIEL